MIRWIVRRLSHRIGASRRGMTLIELMVGLVVIATAAVGTSIAVFNAYGQLQRQRHRMIANQYLRAEVEYWQGRIHSALPPPDQRNSFGPSRDVIIDSRDPANGADDIVAEIRRLPMRELDLVRTGATWQKFWEIPVRIQYYEPSWTGGDPILMEYFLVGYWLESEPTDYNPN